MRNFHVWYECVFQNDLIMLYRLQIGLEYMVSIFLFTLTLLSIYFSGADSNQTDILLNFLSYFMKY